jgi:hypothetical protein
MAKGADFERDISRTLSLWWSHGERDDIFWRTSMSGGRSTVRAKAGKATAYQSGDITATDPIGAPLIKATVIELKRGYKKYCVLDMVDSKNPTKTVLGGFLTQISAELEQAKISNFLLICKRDGREPFVILPYPIKVLINKNNILPMLFPSNEITYGGILIISLQNFLKCEPENYLTAAQEYNNAYTKTT